MVYTALAGCTQATSADASVLHIATSTDAAVLHTATSHGSWTNDVD